MYVVIDVRVLFYVNVSIIDVSDLGASCVSEPPGIHSRDSVTGVPVARKELSSLENNLGNNFLQSPLFLENLALFLLGDPL